MFALCRLMPDVHHLRDLHKILGFKCRYPKTTSKQLLTWPRRACSVLPAARILRAPAQLRHAEVVASFEVAWQESIRASLPTNQN